MRQVFNNSKRNRVSGIADDRNGSRRLLQLLHHARRKGEDDVRSGSDNLASSFRNPLALTATGESQDDKVLSLHVSEPPKFLKERSEINAVASFVHFGYRRRSHRHESDALPCLAARGP